MTTNKTTEETTTANSGFASGGETASYDSFS